MSNKKLSFICDTNGSIIVISALRYALGRMTYVPGAVQDWIKTYWDDLDSNTKSNVVRDVFQHLHENYHIRNDAQFLDAISDYDIREWEKFAIDRYWTLDYDSRKVIDHYFRNSIVRKSWYEDVMMKKLYENQSCR